MFKPTDVNIESLPFVGMLGRSELEVAVAYVIAGRQKVNDWSTPMTPLRLSSALSDVMVHNAYVRDVVKNPFLKPDFDGLMDAGIIDKHYCFTSEGLTKLIPWAQTRLLSTSEFPPN